jgi:hypothetical protein
VSYGVWTMWNVPNGKVVEGGGGVRVVAERGWRSDLSVGTDG